MINRFSGAGFRNHKHYQTDGGALELSAPLKIEDVNSGPAAVTGFGQIWSSDFAGHPYVTLSSDNGDGSDRRLDADPDYDDPFWRGHRYTLAANVNNWNYHTAISTDAVGSILLRLTASRVITGILAASNGTILALTNDSWTSSAGAYLEIAHQSASSTANNRIICSRGVNLRIQPGGTVVLQYLSIGVGAGFWYVIAADELVKNSYIDPTISANQNNYAPTNGGKVDAWYPDVTGATRTVTGIDAAALGFLDGQEFWIAPATNDLVLAHNSGSSNAGNRFNVPGGANITVRFRGGVKIKYNATLNANVPFRVMVP